MAAKTQKEGGSTLTTPTGTLSAAQKKRRELYSLIPEIIQDDVEFREDGCYVLMFVNEAGLSATGMDAIKDIVVSNQGCQCRDSVTGRFMYQFPVEHPTCNKNGEPLNFEHGQDTFRADHIPPKLEPTTAKPTPTYEEVPCKPTTTQPSQAVNATTKLAYTPPKFSPMGQFDKRQCYSCVNVRGNVKPCADWEQCKEFLRVFALQDIAGTLKNIEAKLDAYLNAQNTTTQQQPPQQQTQTQTQTAPPTSTPALSTPNPPTQTQQKTPTTTTPKTPQQQQQPNSSFKPFTEEDQKNYEKQQAKETAFLQGNLVWYKGITSTGKPCEKLYKNKQTSPAAQNQYILLYNHIEFELEKQKRNEKYNLGWDGYFWYKSQDHIKEPFIGRMPTKETPP